MGRDLLGFGQVGQVLTESGEGDTDPGGPGRLGGGDGRGKILAGHEAADGPPDEAQSGQVFLEPALRAIQSRIVRTVVFLRTVADGRKRSVATDYPAGR